MCPCIYRHTVRYASHLLGKNVNAVVQSGLPGLAFSWPKKTNLVGFDIFEDLLSSWAFLKVSRSFYNKVQNFSLLKTEFAIFHLQAAGNTGHNEVVVMTSKAHAVYNFFVHLQHGDFLALLRGWIETRLDAAGD